MDQRLETFLTVCATMNYRKAAELSLIHISAPTRLGLISYAVICL